MSELLYVALDHNQHTWLDVADRGLEIINSPNPNHIGKALKITITQKEKDIDLDGITDQINVTLNGELVDKASGTCFTVGSTEIRTMPVTRSVKSEALSSQAIIFDVWLSARVEEAVRAVLNLEAGMLASSWIPVAV